MYMTNLNQTSFQAIINQINSVLLPIGMMEAHGPHATLATDLLIPREFAKRIDAALGERLLVAPEIPYGHSWGLAPFPGTIDVAGEVFANYVFEVGKGLYLNGLENIILFNGHGGNIPSLSLVSEKLADLGLTVLTINWWLDYREAIIQIAPETGHAGEDETSVIMAIDPALVELGDVSHHVIDFPRNLKLRDGGKAMYPNAFSGNAGAATVAKGEAIIAALLPLMIADIETMWKYAVEAQSGGGK